MKNKNDLNQPATKGDVQKVKIELNRSIETLDKSLRSEMLHLEERIENLEEGQGRIENKLDKIVITLDGFVAGIDNLSTENQVGTYQIKKQGVQLADHEQRIEKLEKGKYIPK